MLTTQPQTQSDINTSIINEDEKDNGIVHEDIIVDFMQLLSCNNETIITIFQIILFILHLLFTIFFMDEEQNNDKCIFELTKYNDQAQQLEKVCYIHTYIVNFVTNIIIITGFFISIVLRIVTRLSNISYFKLEVCMYSLIVIAIIFTFCSNLIARHNIEKIPLEILNSIESFIIIIPIIGIVILGILFNGQSTTQLSHNLELNITLTTINVSNENTTNNDCSICLNKLSENDPVMTTCGHVFHNKCIIKNITEYNNNKCPLCRTEII